MLTPSACKEGNSPVRTVFPSSTAILFVLVFSAIAQTPSSPALPTYIRAGHLFEPTTGHYLDNVTLVVANQRIQSIEAAGFQTPTGAEIIDLSADYVLPGLID